MAITIDLPPPISKEQKTKIEYVQNNNGRNDLDLDNQYLKLDKDLLDNIYLNEKFNTLANAWEENTMFQSSISRIIEDKYFRQIIELDRKAIPLIIDKIAEEPSLLVWALNIITEKSMASTGRETIEQLCKKWVKAYRNGKIQNV